MTKRIRRLLSLLLCAALALGLLSSCGEQGDTQSPSPSPSESEPSPTPSEPSPTPSEEPDPPADPAEQLSAQEIVNSLWFSCLELEGKPTTMITHSSDTFLTRFLGIAEEDYTSYGILSGSGSATELVVLRCPDEDAADRAEAKLQDYATIVNKNQKDIPNIPDASPAAAYRQGLYLGYFQCDHPELAGDALFSILSTGERFDRTAPVTEDPAFKIQDLLLRLLVEGGVCPEWGTLDQDNKGWSDTRDDSRYGNFARLSQVALYGVAPNQYEVCAYANWDTESVREFMRTEDAPGQLLLFQTGGEEQAKALVPILEGGLKALQAEVQADVDYLSAGEFPDDSYYDLNPDQLEKNLALYSRRLERLNAARVSQAGRYTAVLICDDPTQGAVSLPRFVADPDTADFFANYYSGMTQTIKNPDPNYPDRELFTPPGDEDMSIYDTSAILAAWEAGDPAGLSDYDREIYDAAQTVLDEILTDGMTDLEQETAVYSWLTSSVDYDWNHMDVLAETSRDAYGPYGGLVNRKTVCLGYAATFQLLMDMAGIECVTVVGAMGHSTGDHAWNVVRLGGNWYCVDSSADANGREQLGEEYQWRYFNVTSDELAKNHQWDYTSVPEAVTEGNGQ